jgi:hypothetical protein
MIRTCSYSSRYVQGEGATHVTNVGEYLFSEVPLPKHRFHTQIPRPSEVRSVPSRSIAGLLVCSCSRRHWPGCFGTHLHYDTRHFLVDSSLRAQDLRFDALIQAQQTRATTDNQGLYNGFLAAGLIWSAVHPDRWVSRQLSFFFLGCMLVAEIYGARLSTSKSFSSKCSLLRHPCVLSYWMLDKIRHLPGISKHAALSNEITTNNAIKHMSLIMVPRIQLGN